MKRELKTEDIYSNHGDYKTIFAIETGTERKFVHFFGYVYYAERFDDNPSQYCLVEYCGYYVPLDEVLSKGLRAAEMDNIDLAKEYVKDILYQEIIKIYNEYDDGNPPSLLEELTKNTPDGIYILKND